MIHFSKFWLAKLLLAHCRISLCIDLQSVEELESWWSRAFSTFMISKPNLQHSNWMELRIWNGGEGATNHLSVCRWVQGASESVHIFIGLWHRMCVDIIMGCLWTLELADRGHWGIIIIIHRSIIIMMIWGRHYPSNMLIYSNNMGYILVTLRPNYNILEG